MVQIGEPSLRGGCTWIIWNRVPWTNIALKRDNSDSKRWYVDRAPQPWQIVCLAEWKLWSLNNWSFRLGVGHRANNPNKEKHPCYGNGNRGNQHCWVLWASRVIVRYSYEWRWRKPKGNHWQEDGSLECQNQNQEDVRDRKAGKSYSRDTNVKRCDQHFLGISKSRWTGSGRYRTNRGEAVLYSGRDEGQHHKEVTVILSWLTAGRWKSDWRGSTSISPSSSAMNWPMTMRKRERMHFKTNCKPS